MTIFEPSFIENASETEKEKFEKQKVMYYAMQEYVTKSMMMKSLPLPIIEKITKNGEILMYDYIINMELFYTLVNVFPKMIPNPIKKAVFINNNLIDKNVADLFDMFRHNPGL